MLALFPGGTRIAAGVLELDGIPATDLAERFGTPLVVYAEEALRERARMFQRAVPDALVVYGTKAFPNVALMRLLAEEGLGADVSTLGELAFAQRAGIAGERLLVHGNNKSDEELAAAAAADALVVLDALGRAGAGGRRGSAPRPRPRHARGRGGNARVDPHRPPRLQVRARRGRRGRGRPRRAWPPASRSRACTSTSARSSPMCAHTCSRSRCWPSSPTAAGSELDWMPRTIDIGGGFGIRHVEAEPEPPVEELVRTLAAAVEREWQMRGLDAPRLIVEPGRALVGPTAFTLYRVGAVKRAGDRRYVAIDGGMSDNPRPQLYQARYTALLANRADEQPDDVFTIAGKHCESGDVLIERAELPEPRRGDLIAVPATGAYTLGMASNYNGVPRPAAVLVGGGDARLIRRRETVEDLLELEL